jgi:DNA gyrase subunit A
VEIGLVRPINIVSEMRQAYLDYAMSVIVSRALPDVRDGLKPVQRRILYGMWDMGIRHNSQYKKSARIVGDVLGKMHPHSDVAVYDALARLAQEWNIRYPLIDGQGNFGSVDGDPPAAMRYTEARLSRIAEELIYDIEKNTVDFKPNYNGEFEEPTVLPARLPNLLLNGAAGIAVGMATNIPPHNLGELCDAISFLIDSPDATVEDLLERVPGPDFPTGGIILGTEGIASAYATGRGHIIIRAKAHIEEAARGAYHIVVTELPYQVNKARLIERIAELVKDRKIEGIRDVRDESDRSGIRLVIILKQDAQPKKVLNHLFKYTQMQVTFGVNMLALVDGTQPQVLPLKKVLQHYIDHRQNVIRRRTEFELAKARDRAHILEGLKIALDNLDEVISTIRNSRTRDSARNNLMSNFKLSERQANAILEMQLGRLAALERKKIEDEYREVIKLIAQLEDILANPRRVLALIKDDMAYLKEKYNDVRRTRILAEATGDISAEDLIPDLQVLVTLTERGYIKRVNADTYRPQHRGGKGIKGMTTREQDIVQHMVTCNTMDDLLFFTDRGKVYQLKTHEVPDAGRTAKGLPLVNLISLEPNEQVTSVLPVPNFEDGEYLLMATVNGKIKRTILNEYSSVRSNGLIAIGLEAGDELRWVRMSKGDEDVLLTTRSGQTIRFRQAQVRPMGRPASGVTGIDLRNKDQVVGMDLVREGASLLVVTKRGQGKRTELDEYPAKGRATGGVITMKLRPGDSIAVAQVIDASDTLTFITRQGIVIKLAANSISCLGRSTQGVRVINLNASDEVAAMSIEPFQEDLSDPSVMSSAEAGGEDGAPTNGKVNGAQQEPLL